MEDSLFAVWQKNPTIETLDLSKKYLSPSSQKSHESLHHHACPPQNEETQNGTHPLITLARPLRE